MKNFLKQVGATLVGIIIFFIIIGALGLMSLVGMVASSSSSTDVSDNSVFVVSLDGIMDERSEASVIDKLKGNATGMIGLDDLLSAIKKAKENDKIKGIYIESGAFVPDSYASIQAVRKALLDFKKSGKWIIAYGDTYTQATYYLASVADKIYLNPQGMLDWHGMAAETYYVKDVLAKFGVQMQVIKVGAYKSATEMYTGDKMSEPNRRQVEAYVGGIWGNVCTDIAKSRNLSVAKLNEYADNLITFEDPKNYISLKLIDGLLYTDQVKDKVKEMMKLDKDDDFNTVGLAAMGNVKSKSEKGDEIAVYYAYGNIVDNAAGGIMGGGGHLIVGNDVARDLRDLADDEDVKAIVIRVNSGGGSAYASEQIWRAVQLAKAKKPVVVSMGGMAASGGYYMSCAANWIVAEPTTLTGSIGIFGVIPDVSGLLTQKLGVKFDGVQTNKHSAFGTMSRPFNEEEKEYLGAYIERGYRTFRQRVADGRHLTINQVENIAQGHVWLGQDALKIKLVDQLGGLDEALAKAAQLAKLQEYHAESYPAKADMMDQLLSEVDNSGDSYLDEKMRSAMGEFYPTFMLLKNIGKESAVQARMPYILKIR